MFKFNKNMGEVATTEEEIKNILGKMNHGDIKRINGKNMKVLHFRSHSEMKAFFSKMRIDQSLEKYRLERCWKKYVAI